MKSNQSFLIFFFIIILLKNLSFAQSKLKGEVNKKIDVLVQNIVQSYKTLQHAKYRNTIAIFDFDEQSKAAKESMLGHGVSELLITRLSETGIFNIVDRKNLKKIFKEISLGTTGILDENTIAQAGKMVGADIIVVGSISELGNYFNINVRLIEVETGKILTSSVVEIEKWLLIKTTEYFRPAKYRIGVGTKLYFLNQSIKGPEIIVTLNYLYEITNKSLLEFEVGYGFSNKLYNEADGSDLYINGIWQGRSYHRYAMPDGGFFELSFKLNHWILQKRNFNISIFSGFGLVGGNVGYEYSDEEWHTEPTEHKMFPTIPIGASFSLFYNKNVSFKIDLGYMISLSKLERQYPKDIPEKPSPVSVSKDGFLCSLKILVYL